MKGCEAWLSLKVSNEKIRTPQDRCSMFDWDKINWSFMAANNAECKTELMKTLAWVTDIWAPHVYKVQLQKFDS